MAEAFVGQMEAEANALRIAKQEIEMALSKGGHLGAPTGVLVDANKKYQTASLAVRKNCVMPKPKAKAKAAA